MHRNLNQWQLSMIFLEIPISMSVTSLVLYTVGATVMLVVLSCLLVHSERFVSCTYLFSLFIRKKC